MLFLKHATNIVVVIAQVKMQKMHHIMCACYYCGLSHCDIKYGRQRTQLIFFRTDGHSAESGVKGVGYGQVSTAIRPVFKKYLIIILRR